MMKLFIVALFCYVAFASACRDDSDCEDGCCIGIAAAKKCFKYLKYGEKCTLRHKMGARCVCRPGLTCEKVGFITRKCKYHSNPLVAPKPSANAHKCEQDYECPGGCCVGVGKLKYCLDYLKLNEKCTIRSVSGVRCVCEPGLKCVKTGMITKRCKPI